MSTILEINGLKIGFRKEEYRPGDCSRCEYRLKCGRNPRACGRKRIRQDRNGTGRSPPAPRDAYCLHRRFNQFQRRFNTGYRYRRFAENTRCFHRHYIPGTHEFPEPAPYSAQATRGIVDPSPGTEHGRSCSPIILNWLKRMGIRDAEKRHERVSASVIRRGTPSVS